MGRCHLLLAGGDILCPAESIPEPSKPKNNTLGVIATKRGNLEKIRNNTKCHIYMLKFGMHVLNNEMVPFAKFQLIMLSI